MNLSSLSLSLTARRHVELDPARLFQTAGRVGVCYTSDTGGVSWDDLIAQNMRALGPELVVNGGFDDGLTGWHAPINGALITASAGRLTVSGSGTAFPRARQLYSTPRPGTAFVVLVDVASVSSGASAIINVFMGSGASEPSTAALRMAPGVHRAIIGVDGVLAVMLGVDTANGTAVFNSISIREIDLSKCTLYHDSAATVPVLYPIAAGQGMGFLRDRSAGSELGAELVANRSFDTSDNWALTGFSIEGGVLKAVSVAQGSNAIQSGSVTNALNKAYQCELHISSYSAGSARLQLEGAAGPSFSSAGRHTFVIVAATASPRVFVTATAPNTSLEVGDISVRELPGYPLSQPTLSARGEFSRRYNLLTATATLSTQSVTTIATTYRLLFSGAGTVTLSGTATSTLSAGSHTITATAGTLTLTVSGAVTEADLRFTADTHIGKPYQRTTTASDYDEEGFPTYLRRQTDDWARAFAVNPNGATKALCFWAGQKMSDAATAIAFETSNQSSATNGALSIFGPGTVGPTYSSGSRGTFARFAEVVNAAYGAPSRHVVKTQTSITNDVNQLYINGTLAASNSDDQGTGTYLTYDLFEGARAGTSLFANTRTYTPPMLMFIQPADPGPTASEIARLEAKYLRAAGVVS